MKTFEFDIASTAKDVRVAGTNPDTYDIRGASAITSVQVREPIAEIRKVEMLTTAQLDIMNRGRCPDCNHRGFVMGPRRRNAINIECGKLDVSHASTSRPVSTILKYSPVIASQGAARAVTKIGAIRPDTDGGAGRT